MSRKSSRFAVREPAILRRDSRSFGRYIEASSAPNMAINIKTLTVSIVISYPFVKLRAMHVYSRSSRRRGFGAQPREDNGHAEAGDLVENDAEHRHDGSDRGEKRPDCAEELDDIRLWNDPAER
jgi:hypothetical protein